MKVMTLEQLVEDLKEAKTAAVAAHDATVDVGTCNMDCVFLEVPKTQHKLVKEALSVASVQGSEYTWMGVPGFLLTPLSRGQANARSAAMEAMMNSLAKAGYDVCGYYVMD
jgi:hypothetical protein